MNLLSQLLNHYHLTLKDLGVRKTPGSFQHLDTPKDCPDFKKVIGRLKQAKENNEKTVIYGDYDVDGLTATAIMKLALDEFGISCGYFIPSRYKEGYGLSVKRVEEFYEKGYRLIITVDNGISAFESIDKARELGMDVIVIDHHEIPQEKVNTPYVFHFRSEGFLSYPCSGASLAFFVACSLLRRYDPYFATLAGIAVFSDIMPLVGNNLELVKIMYASLHEKKYPNLMYLLSDNDAFTYEDISFGLIPLLNAPGRICKDSLSTNYACRFLQEKVRLLNIQRDGSMLKEINMKRKTIVNSMCFENEFVSDHAVVVRANDYSGLSGLFANRILKEQNKSVLVFAPKEDDPTALIGSIRVDDEHNAMDFIHHNEKYFLAAGGHPKAAGVTIRAKDYYQIATLFAAEMAINNKENAEEKNPCIEIDLEDLNEENYQIYQSFQPFGEGFPAPVFRIQIERDKFRLSPSKKAAFAYADNHQGKITLFSSLDLLEDENVSVITVEGTFKKESFRGKESYVLLCDVAKKYI